MEIMKYFTNTMTSEDWKDIEYFKPHEFSHPEKMKKFCIFRLDLFRKKLNAPMTITSDYRTNSPNHIAGLAVDFKTKASFLNVLETAIRTNVCGFGWYLNPDNSLFYHIDWRRTEEKRLWSRHQKVYKDFQDGIDKVFLR